MALSRDARLLFIGIWNFADDEGRFKLSPLTLKAQILPGDDGLTKSDIIAWLSEIIRGELVECYTNGRELFGEVTGWKKHQKIDKPQPAKCPGLLDKDSVRRTFDEYSALIRGEVATERESRERRVEKRERAPVRAREENPQPPEQAEKSDQPPASQPDSLPPDAPKPLAGSLATLLDGLSQVSADRAAALDAAETLVRVEFVKRFEAAEEGLWTRSGDPAVATLARWALSVPGGAEAAVKRLLDNFFADTWCRSRHFPVDHLARHVQKYFDPRKAPASAARFDPDARLAELRARLGVLEGDLACASQATDEPARIKKLIGEVHREMRLLKGAE
jgi:hypothetical protein